MVMMPDHVVLQGPAFSSFSLDYYNHIVDGELVEIQAKVYSKFPEFDAHVFKLDICILVIYMRPAPWRIHGPKHVSDFELPQTSELRQLAIRCYYDAPPIVYHRRV